MGKCKGAGEWDCWLVALLQQGTWVCGACTCDKQPRACMETCGCRQHAYGANSSTPVGGTAHKQNPTVHPTAASRHQACMRCVFRAHSYLFVQKVGPCGATTHCGCKWGVRLREQEHIRKVRGQTTYLSVVMGAVQVRMVVKVVDRGWMGWGMVLADLAAVA